MDHLYILARGEEIEFIFVAIVMVLAFISWIFKAISKAAKKDEGQAKKKEGIEAFLERMVKRAQEQTKAGRASRQEGKDQTVSEPELEAHSEPPPIPPQSPGTEKKAIGDFIRPRTSPIQGEPMEVIKPQLSGIEETPPIMPLITSRPEPPAPRKKPPRAKKYRPRRKVDRVVVDAESHGPAIPASTAPEPWMQLKLDNIEDLRKAIVLHTVLSPPKSISREQQLWD
jgi:hypothetical protein